VRRELRQGNLICIKAILTAMSISRRELGGLPVDFESIVKPSSADSNTIDLIAAFSKEYFEHIDMKPYNIPVSTLTVSDYEKGLSRDQWLQDLPFHWTLKSGPNGPAMITALNDYLALDEKLIKLLIIVEPRLKAILETLSLYNLKEGAFETQIMAGLSIQGKKLKPSIGLRKLSVKKDKETKSRVFAILDYWSQLSVKGLHDHLFKMLKTIPNDCSFDQLSGTRLKDVVGLKVSADLSAATDRFPIDLQVKILTRITNAAFAEAWRAIMVDQPFYYENKFYKYNAGQPMGAHSSWAVFTMCHHVVIAYCFKTIEGRMPSLTDYSILGDDIVIVGKDVSRLYVDIMNSLGVEISFSKTHSSE
jgi:hypothetical protein